MQQKIRQYRAEVGAILLPTINFCLVAGIILFAAIAYKDQLENPRKVLEATLIFESVNIPFILLLMLGATFDYKIIIYSDGISSYDPFGTRKCDFMLWTSMNRVSRKGIIGYQYYLVENNVTGERLWIPYKIKNKEDFARVLNTQAGAANVLSTEVMKG